MSKAQGVRAGKAFIELSLKDKTQAGIKAVQARLKAFGAGLKSLANNLKQIGGGLQSLGGQMLKFGAMAGAGAGLATKVFADFDDQMRTVKAVTKGTDEEFARLTETAKELGRTTSFTAAQVAAVMVELGRAGFSRTQIDEMTAGVLDLSRATGTEAAQAAGIMAATIRQYNLEAADAARVSDVLTQAANGSFNTLESLGEAMSYVGPVAADVRMSIEETAAALMALGNAGIQGSSAGTVLRRILLESSSSADAMREIFGVEALDAAGNLRPIVDVLAEINDVTKGLGSGERAAKFNQFFGLLGVTGASVLGGAAGDIRQFLAELQNAGGVASKTAQEMDAGLGGSFRKLLSAAEGVAIAIGETLAPTLRTWADELSSLAGWITGTVTKNRELFVAIGKGIVVLAAAGVTTIGLGMAFTAAGAAITGLLAVGKLLLTLGVPLAIIGTAAYKLGQYFFTATESGRAMAAELTSAFQTLSNDARTAWGGIVDALATGDLELAGKIAIQVLTLEWKRFVSVLQEIWSGFKVWWVDYWGDLSRTTAKFINDVGLLKPLSRMLGVELDVDNAFVDELFDGAERGIKAQAAKDMADAADDIRKAEEELQRLRDQAGKQREGFAPLGDPMEGIEDKRTAAAAAIAKIGPAMSDLINTFARGTISSEAVLAGATSGGEVAWRAEQKRHHEQVERQLQAIEQHMKNVSDAVED